MPSCVLEVCCFSVESAIVAAAAGAHRIELCAERRLDGVTPSMVDVAAVCAHYGVLAAGGSTPPQVHVMLRPPPPMDMATGGANVFVLSEEGKSTILESIAHLGAGLQSSCGGTTVPVNGVVVGALRPYADDIDADNTTRSSDGGRFVIDWCFMEQVVTAAHRSGIRDLTFHRAFDFADSMVKWSPQEAARDVDALAALGFSRVLLCGTHRLLDDGATVQERMERILALSRQSTAVAAHKLTLMPAGGVNAHTIEAWLLHPKNGAVDGPDRSSHPLVKEFHGSFIDASTTRSNPSRGEPLPDTQGIADALSKMKGLCMA